MANRNNPQNVNQQSRTRNRNRDYNRDYDRDYGYNNQRPYDTYYYATAYNFPYDEDFNDYDYDYDTGYYYPDSWTYREYWYVPGPFTGYGPSDWQRQDENIREDVNERLTMHGHLDARQMHVQVDNGVVTLTGSVPSRREKRMAEDIADSVGGVRDVQNQLRVEHRNRQNQSGQGRGRSSANVQGGQIYQGMEVDSSDNRRIGTIKEIRNDTILVDRSVKQDIFIPFNAFSVQNDRVVLRVSADQVDNQGWRTPETRAVETHV